MAGRNLSLPVRKKIIRIAGKGGKTLDEYAEKLSRIQQFRPIDDTFFEVIVKDKEACQEAGRCLRCDHFGFGVFKGGRTKKW